ncbi:Uncharacterised protein [Vibrio cholerae]|nr:Uncharacterised protein [Vibrio cholerae]
MRYCPSYTSLKSPDCQLALTARRASTEHHR